MTVQQEHPLSIGVRPGAPVVPLIEPIVHNDNRNTYERPTEQY